jgi:hypothetical protein
LDANAEVESLEEQVNQMIYYRPIRIMDISFKLKQNELLGFTCKQRMYLLENPQSSPVVICDCGCLFVERIGVRPNSHQSVKMGLVAMVVSRR